MYENFICRSLKTFLWQCNRSKNDNDEDDNVDDDDDHVKVEVLLRIYYMCHMSIANYLSSLSSTGRRRSGILYLVT